MAENDQLSLLAGERTGKDAAQAIVLRVRKITGPKQKMVAVGKKQRPAMRLIILRPDAQRSRRDPRSVRVDALERTLRVCGKQDYALASPTAAASSQTGGKHLWRATRDRDFLQFAVREKSHVGTIRRPEGITRSLRAGQKCYPRRSDMLHVEHW